VLNGRDALYLSTRRTLPARTPYFTGVRILTCGTHHRPATITCRAFAVAYCRYARWRLPLYFFPAPFNLYTALATVAANTRAYGGITQPTLPAYRCYLLGITRGAAARAFRAATRR